MSHHHLDACRVDATGLQTLASKRQRESRRKAQHGRTGYQTARQVSKVALELARYVSHAHEG
jgi:hypothetical protein